MIITHWEREDGPRLADSTAHADRAAAALEKLEASRRGEPIDFDPDAWPPEVRNAYAAAVALCAEPGADRGTIGAHMRLARPYLEALREAMGAERFRAHHSVGARLLAAFR